MAIGVALALAPASSAELLDRVVAIVGDEPITASEVDREVRLQALFSDIEPDESESAATRALERLIERRLMQREIALAAFLDLSAEQFENAFRSLQSQRFRGRTYFEALERYGLTEQDVKDYLREQLTFERYLSFRFQAEPSPDDLEAEYRRRFGRQASPEAPPLEAVQEELTDAWMARRIERQLDDRVRELRALVRIVYLEPLPPEGPQ